jgi:glycosyltransferase involved in cell wall biosynthesis
LFRAFIRHSAKRADRVVTDSAASRADVLRYYGLPPDKVTTIHLGGASAAYHPRPTAAAELAQQGWARPFVLYVGAFHERKNVPRLIEAYAQARQTTNLPQHLVLIGKAQPAQRAALEALIARLGLGDCVHCLPPVAEHALPLFYAAAQAFIYPSRYEGFGLPVLEAMASGTPVITTRSSSLAEVAGDAAVLVDPEDTDALAQAIVTVLTDEALRARLAALGLARAALFSWDTCARQTAEAYAAAGAH